MGYRVTAFCAVWFFSGFLVTAGAQDAGGAAPEKGSRVTFSIRDSLPVYQQKAEQGDVDAQMMMGQVYVMGDVVEADMKKAAFWFGKAAAQGNAEGQFRLAEMYLYGQGVERNLTRAADWARKSAEQGYMEGEYLFGLLYAEGKGVAEDWKTATRWLCRAAARGSQSAIDLLDTRTLTGEISGARDGEGIKDWCGCTSGRLSDC